MNRVERKWKSCHFIDVDAAQPLRRPISFFALKSFTGEPSTHRQSWEAIAAMIIDFDVFL